MASRSLGDLHPRLRPLAERFLADAKNAGIDVLVTCTYRSGAEQDALYAQGRPGGPKGAIVTNARAGQSAHNYMLDGKPASLAFDVVPLVAGKPQWDAKHPAWQRLGAIGTALGLDWAGNWRTFREYPHFELKLK